MPDQESQTPQALNSDADAQGGTRRNNDAQAQHAQQNTMAAEPSGAARFTGGASNSSPWPFGAGPFGPYHGGQFGPAAAPQYGGNSAHLQHFVPANAAPPCVGFQLQSGPASPYQNSGAFLPNYTSFMGAGASTSSMPVGSLMWPSPAPPGFSGAFAAASSSAAGSPGTPAGPPMKRRPGRPPGSKNRKKEEEDVPVGNGAPAVATVPARAEGDYDVPEHDELCCSNCSLYSGNFFIVPCGHYGFCHQCLKAESDLAEIENRPAKCLACNEVSTEFLKCFRSNI